MKKTRVIDWVLLGSLFSTLSWAGSPQSVGDHPGKWLTPSGVDYVNVHPELTAPQKAQIEGQLRKAFEIIKPYFGEPRGYDGKPSYSIRGSSLVAGAPAPAGVRIGIFEYFKNDAVALRRSDEAAIGFALSFNSTWPFADKVPDLKDRAEQELSIRSLPLLPRTFAGLPVYAYERGNSGCVFLSAGEEPLWLPVSQERFALAVRSFFEAQAKQVEKVPQLSALFKKEIARVDADLAKLTPEQKAAPMRGQWTTPSQWPGFTQPPPPARRRPSPDDLPVTQSWMALNPKALASPSLTHFQFGTFCWVQPSEALPRMKELMADFMGKFEADGVSKVRALMQSTARSSAALVIGTRSLILSTK